MADGTSNLWVPVIAGAFSLGGVWVGSLLNRRATSRAAHERKMRELRIGTYASLMGLKVPFAQTSQTLAEAKVLCEYYETRSILAGNPQDLEEAKRQNERALNLIPRVSELRQKLAEALGHVQIAFPSSDELDSAIEVVYRSPALNITALRGKVTTLETLEVWFAATNEGLAQNVAAHYSGPIDKLIGLLRPHARAA